MKIFVDNLNDLIMESERSLRQLEKESGVSAMQYSRYLKGSIPTIDVTLKIAQYFDVSLDYLFGLSNKRKSEKHAFDMSKFLNNYNKLLKENNTTHYKFMKDSPFDESIIRHWKNGSTPRLDVVYYIAKNLNGSIDDLIS